MPTEKPRINLTMQPHRYELVKRLAAAQGVSMASVLTEILDQVWPVLERVCVVLEAARRAKETQLVGMREAAAAAESELVPIMYQATTQFDMFIEDAQKAFGEPLVEAPTATETIRKARSASKGANPRPVIRGSGLSAPPTGLEQGKPRKADQKGDSGDMRPKCTCTVTDDLRVWNKSCPVHRRG